MVVQRARAAFGDPALAPRALQHDDQLSVTQYRDVGVVGAEHQLAHALVRPHPRHHTLPDEPVVEVVLRLIDDQRARQSRKQQQKQRGRLLTLRQVVQVAEVRLGCTADVELSSGGLPNSYVPQPEEQLLACRDKVGGLRTSNTETRQMLRSGAARIGERFR